MTKGDDDLLIWSMVCVILLFINKRCSVISKDRPIKTLEGITGWYGLIGVSNLTYIHLANVEELLALDIVALDRFLWPRFAIEYDGLVTSIFVDVIQY